MVSGASQRAEVRKSTRQKQLDKPAPSSPSPTQLDTACSTSLKIGGRKSCHSGFSLLSNMPINFKADGEKKKKEESGLEGGTFTKPLNNRVESFRWKRVWWPKERGIAVILKQIRALSFMNLEEFTVIRCRYMQPRLAASKSETVLRLFIDLCIRTSLVGTYHLSLSGGGFTRWEVRV